MRNILNKSKRKTEFINKLKLIARFVDGKLKNVGGQHIFKLQHTNSMKRK